MTWKGCELECKLVFISNRKSHMSLRLVPKSVTLNDLQWRNDCYLAVFSPNSVDVGADHVKVVEDTPRLSANVTQRI